jgi:altronate hydrolase
VLTTIGPVTPGNRFALEAIGSGEFVRQYGQPIGTSRGIAAGEPVTPHNMSNDVPVVREIAEDLATPAPDWIPEGERATFRGIRRADGRVGTRNWIVIAPTSMCASHEATQIAMLAEHTLLAGGEYPGVDGVVALPHNKGCGCPDGSNVDVVLNVLGKYAAHPNVGAVVFIDLGCEKTNRAKMEKHLGFEGLALEGTTPDGAAAVGLGKPHAWIGIQDVGGTKQAIQRGLEEIERMLPKAAEIVREDVPVSELVLGVECGGSDGHSGLSANPSLGNAADQLVRSGGTVILSEVPEWCGAEHILAGRARNAEVGRAIYSMVDWFKQHATAGGADLGENPSPGNVAGGLLNITIKSLGAIAKGGTTRVEGVTPYGVEPEGRGLQLMQGPGYDQESVPGLVASGANVVVFTTGRGTTIGNAIVPVIKLSSNTPTYERMTSDIDLSAGGVIDGVETIEDVGARVFERVRSVAGKEQLALAEENGHREFQIWGANPVSL